MATDRTSRFPGERRAGKELRPAAARAIDCGDPLRMSSPVVFREPGIELAHAAFSLARNAPKFGSSAQSFGEQHQAI
jgi:hypothetical protein